MPATVRPTTAAAPMQNATIALTTMLIGRSPTAAYRPLPDREREAHHRRAALKSRQSAPPYCSERLYHFAAMTDAGGCPTPVLPSGASRRRSRDDRSVVEELLHALVAAVFLVDEAADMTELLRVIERRFERWRPSVGG
jgi:hypothetical protein